MNHADANPHAPFDAAAPKYRYARGDRPLEGYTIEHAVGRGGFGEVYYARSDAGREVALKALQYGQEIELRGIGHCMNLKSPHLVTIFDVRQNDRGEWFVIMEYVAGPSLGDLINQHPEGLGHAKTAYLLRETAKALADLHAYGIVHRDLKPSNIFYEDGIVKIGDYSLSKAISASRHSGHTLTVGTVHYMAPEIGRGAYDTRTDIYALGVILYEMLTGRVPYGGASPGEVLMQHITGEVDLTDIDEPFARVIREAMAVSPDERYADVRDMTAAILGDAHVQQSMSGFRPQSLTEAGERMGAKLGEKAGERGEDRAHVGQDGIHTFKRGRDGAVKQVNIGPDGIHVTKRDRDGAITKETHLVGGGHGADQPTAAASRTPSVDPNDIDPIGQGQRYRLAGQTIAVVAIAIGALEAATGAGVPAFDPFGVAGAVAFRVLFMAAALAVTTAVMTGAIRATATRAEAPLFADDAALRRFSVGVSASIALFVVTFAAVVMRGTMDWPTLGVQIAGLFLADWSKVAAPDRAKRMSWEQPITLAIVGGIAGAIFGGSPVHVGGLLAGISLTLQVASPWNPTLAAQARAKADDEDDDDDDEDSSDSHPAHAAGKWWSELVSEDEPESARPSPRNRTVALILALLPIIGVPLCGIHRFYVGKTLTGLLWLVTLGIFGIGQLIDIILIAAGGFTDARGRSVTRWTLTTPDAPPGRRAAAGAQPAALDEDDRPFSAMLAGVLLLTAFVAALLLVLDAPAAIHAGLLMPMIDTGHLTRWLGHPDWPELLHRFGPAMVLMILLAALVAARTAGASVRRIVGGVMLFVALVPLHLATGRANAWPGIVEAWQAEQRGLALDRFLMQFTGMAWGPTMIAVVLLAVALVLLTGRERRVARRATGGEA